MTRPGPIAGSSPDKGIMDTLLRGCGIHLPPDQLNQLWLYHQLLRRRNLELNLTRIHRFENMVLKLYADSILPGRMVALPSPLLDLGTGPGMPGIPLKITNPHVDVRLAEGRRQRTSFLQEVVDELGLEGITIIPHRITAQYSDPVAAVITRAVEPIVKTLERIQGCLQADGLAVFMKGPSGGAETEEAVKRFKGAFRLELDQDYRIGASPHRRKLVVFRRTAPLAAPAPANRQMIESESNSLFKDLKKLLGGRGIKKQNRAIVSGRRLIADIHERSPELGRLWLRTRGMPGPPVDWRNVEPVELAPALFSTLDLSGTRFPLLVIEPPAVRTWLSADGLAPGCTLLVPFQDPENVGAVIRSAAAFGVQQVVILAEGANPYHPKAIRASGGAVLAVTIYQGPSLNDLPEDLPVLALSAEGRDVTGVDFPNSFVLLPGLEGPGLPPIRRVEAVAVPMTGPVESLNAAVATAVVLYEWARRKHGREE